MTASKKPKFVTITTPAGVAQYPKLNTPDTKYKANGEYSTKLVLKADEAAPIIEKYEEVLAAFVADTKAELMKGNGKDKAKAKALKIAADKPYKPEFDDEGEETGNVVFNFKMPATIPRKDKPTLVLTPDIFSASGKKLETPPEIWGGSVLRASVQLRPFDAPIGLGVSMRLLAVQIIELKSAGSRDASAYGFGNEPGAEDDEDEGEDTPAGEGSDASDDNEDF